MERKQIAVKMEKEEMCEHMRAMVEYCRENRVYFGGCGDCGSPWLWCDICDRSVDYADHVFDEFYGGHKEWMKQQGADTP